MNRKKSYGKLLTGFTLMEQIIVLALTTLVALIGFTALSNFQRLTRKIQDNANIDRALFLLHTALDNDLRNSSKVSWDEGLKFSKLTQTVRYEFNKKYIIREAQEEVDTFRFVPSDLKVSGLSGNDEFIEEFSFKVTIGPQKYDMSFIKEYPENLIWELHCQK